MDNKEPPERVAIKCKECGSKACICEDSGFWAAHCMNCKNSIGAIGFYDPCAPTEAEAIDRWNKLNRVAAQSQEKAE